MHSPRHFRENYYHHAIMIYISWDERNWESPVSKARFFVPIFGHLCC